MGFFLLMAVIMGGIGVLWGSVYALKAFYISDHWAGVGWLILVGISGIGLWAFYTSTWVVFWPIAIVAGIVFVVWLMLQA